MFNRRHFIALGALAAVSACSQIRFVPLPPGTTLIMVRHGDRDCVNLSDKGRARAAALVDALDGVAIDAIYSPETRRNIDTATPLANARGLTIQQTKAVTAAEELLAALETEAGKTIVWVGNQDNLAAIWASLALEGPPPIEYGNLFTVSATETGQRQIRRQQFGPD